MINGLINRTGRRSKNDAYEFMIFSARDHPCVGYFFYIPVHVLQKGERDRCSFQNDGYIGTKD